MEKTAAIPPIPQPLIPVSFGKDGSDSAQSPIPDTGIFWKNGSDSARFSFSDTGIFWKN
ncbi:hypothetical protein VIBNIFTn2_120065 [Vibrio nigripulchritudo FTn2]|nr:hypothetical protein VIBNIFTn2_120065 [Vibrio nigripulchritudo FTn2]